MMRWSQAGSGRVWKRDEVGDREEMVGRGHGRDDLRWKIREEMTKLRWRDDMEEMIRLRWKEEMIRLR